MTLEIIKMIWKDLKNNDDLCDTEKSDTLRGLMAMYGDIIKIDRKLKKEMEDLWDEWD